MISLLMKLFDKMLISAAGLSVYGIAMIVFSGELSSEYFPEKIKKIENKNSRFEEFSGKVPGDIGFESKIPDQSPKEIVVYNKEIDEIIEAYFKNIRQNPEKLEEENRLINESETINSADSGELKAEVKSKKETSGGMQYRKHMVSNGDSLWRISQKYDVPVYTIISANPEKEKEIIHPGDTLNIPSRTGIFYTVKGGDSISLIAKKYKVSSSEIIAMNHLRNSTILNGQKLFLPDARPLNEFKIVNKNRFIWPISGAITSGYGMRKHPLNNSRQFHTGIDIAANSGKEILATADGVVVFAGDGGTYGNMVILRHKDGYLSVYAHASSLLVKKDQFIKQRQLIGRVGATGVTTGPHLHFEIKKSNLNVNPIQALNEKIKIKLAVNS